MPGKVKVQIICARDLPVMDRANNTTDAFVEVKFGSSSFKTDVCRKTLNPQWNSDIFRFEVDDEELQDEPLQIRVFDHDTYSAHDAIGKVYIGVNPLLMKDRPSSISGWFPIYDTMHGIRGELKVVVKLELFSDFNKFRQSSCGVMFFHTSGVPQGFRIQAIHGFVEELVVNDDPEYDWIDKIRSMRASNEARQIQFSKLSGELQRKIGLKVLEMGGNSVIGYRQCFDLEGESGVVVRGIGTSVSVHKMTTLNMTPPFSASPGKDVYDECCPLMPSSPTNLIPTGGRHCSSPAKGSAFPLARRSSESDIGTPPKGGSLGGSSGSGGGGGLGHKVPYHRPMLEQESIDMLEYPFFTTKAFPPGFLVHLGGVVSARSVKLLDRIHNPDEPETRDTWWTELRTEVRSHARAMGCHAVIGYSEETSICDEIIVLSACGTAAMINLQMASAQVVTLSLDRSQFEKEKESSKKLHVDVNLANQVASGRLPTECEVQPQCSVCHVPYKETSLPFKILLTKCAICRKHKVPDILFTTIELPLEVPIVGKGCLIQARIFRQKKDGKGEANAREISESLPFMEIELHNQLINKLKVKGMNALFGLKIQFSVGDRLLLAIATATAVFCAPMAPPPLPRVLSKVNLTTSNNSLPDMQRKILETINKNKEIYGLQALEGSTSELSPHPSGTESELSPRNPLTDDSEDETTNELELSNGSKDTFILEIDDAEDVQLVSVLLDPPIPEGFEICNTETVPGVTNGVQNLQMFTRVWRDQIRGDKLVSQRSLSNIFDNIIRSLCFKLRSFTPCALCKLSFDVNIPEEDEIQVTVSGVCVGLGEPPQLSNGLVEVAGGDKRTPDKPQQKCDSEDLMFPMDMSSTDCAATFSQKSSITTTPNVKVPKSGKEKKTRYHSGNRQRQGVEITPLNTIPRSRIDQYLGHVNFFMIRESTAVREEGGLNGFLHSFVAEMMAICRAHVSCLGGNALVAYRISECVLDENLHKNQSQCLLNVSGDIVMVTYGVDSHHPGLYTPGSTGSSKGGSVSPLPLEHRSSHKGTPRNSPRSSPKSTPGGAPVTTASAH